jgi:ATP-dependent protease ClpP protease subunit
MTITVPGMEDYQRRRAAWAGAVGAGAVGTASGESGRPAGAAWYSITNSADGSAATVSIYDEIGWFGVTAAEFCAALAELDVDTLDVRLNTPGGDVFDGVAIYNALLNHRAEVTATVDGLAASIGSVIAQAGDNRIMAKASQMMIHDASALCIGNARDMTAAASMLDKVSGMIAMVYADRSGGTVASWRAAMLAETWYTAEEAKTAGLVDAVYGQAEEAATAKWDLRVFAHAGRAAAPAPVMPERRHAEKPAAKLGFAWDPALFKDAVRLARP